MPFIQITPVSGPSARAWVNFVWDAHNQQVVMNDAVGGPGGQTWLFSDTSGWTQVTPTPAPGHRYAPVAVYDTQNERMLIYGGNSTELWQYDKDGAYSLLTPTATPAQRYSHTACWDSTNNRMLVFGGYTSTYTNETWSFNSSEGWVQYTPTPSVGPRFASSLVWDSQNQRALLYGGWDTVASGNTGELWQFTNAGGWLLLDPGTDQPSVAEIRDSHCAVWDPVNNRMLVFGGTNSGGNLFNDFWQYTAADGWKELNPPVRPSGRQGAGSAWDSTNNRMLIFGGTNVTATVHLSDFWQYSN